MKFDNKENNQKIKDFERNANISKMLLSKFLYNSNINSNRMNELLLTMSKIHKSMIKNPLSSFNYSTIKIDLDGYNTSKLLMNTINKSQQLLKEYEKCDEIEGLNNKRKNKNKKRLSPENLKIKSKNKSYDLNKLNSEFDLIYNCSTNQKDVELAKKKFNSFLKERKINNLKNEILMNQHKKKISIHKIFEPEKNYHSKIFLRNIHSPRSYSNIRSRYLDYENLDDKKYENQIRNFCYSAKKKNYHSLIYSNIYKNKRNLISEISNELTNSTEKKKEFRRPLSSYRSYNNIHTNKNNFFKVNQGKKRIILKYVNNINKIAINKGLNLGKNCLKKSNSMKYILNEKNNFNLEKINKEMGFDNASESISKDVNKEELLINKTNQIKKYLNKEGKKILFETLKKILNEDRILNKRVNYNDQFDRVFEKRRREKNFHKLAKQSIIIEKSYGKKIVPENEKELIIKMSKKFVNKEKNSKEEMETNLIKYQILNDIDNQLNKKIKKNKY